MNFILDDGGRAGTGFRGYAGDCVTRAIAIAAELPYRKVYDALNAICSGQRRWKGRKGSSRIGVPRRVYHKYLTSIGFKWVPTMEIGKGCHTHLRPEELPGGRLVTRLSGHLSAVIDGVIHDLYDTSRDGMRCVYGYYRKD